MAAPGLSVGEEGEDPVPAVARHPYDALLLTAGPTHPGDGSRGGSGRQMGDRAAEDHVVELAHIEEASSERRCPAV